jgi:RimJ/RimL family protein N-acetyltransferase
MLTLRPATLNDWARLYAWRNDPVTRSHSVFMDPIPLEHHLAWLRATLARPDRAVYVAQDGDRCVGTGRVYRHDDFVELAIAIDPRLRGLGYGAALVGCLVAAAGDAPTLLARVKIENLASLRAFAANDFVPVEGADPALVVMTRARPLHAVSHGMAVARRADAQPVG